MKKIEVKNFKLYTTAVISIEWKQELLNVNLDLAMMLKMMRMEGLTEADIERYSKNGQPIPFKKVHSSFSRKTASPDNTTRTNRSAKTTTRRCSMLRSKSNAEC